MAKAIFHRVFNATDLKKGVSKQVAASDQPQTLPKWVIDLAVVKGAATIVEPKQKQQE